MQSPQSTSEPYGVPTNLVVCPSCQTHTAQEYMRDVAGGRRICQWCADPSLANAVEEGDEATNDATSESAEEETLISDESQEAPAARSGLVKISLAAALVVGGAVYAYHHFTSKEPANATATTTAQPAGPGTGGGKTPAASTAALASTEKSPAPAADPTPKAEPKKETPALASTELAPVPPVKEEPKAASIPAGEPKAESTAATSPTKPLAETTPPPAPVEPAKPPMVAKAETASPTTTAGDPPPAPTEGDKPAEKEMPKVVKADEAAKPPVAAAEPEKKEGTPPAKAEASSALEPAKPAETVANGTPKSESPAPDSHKENPKAPTPDAQSTLTQPAESTPAKSVAGGSSTAAQAPSGSSTLQPSAPIPAKPAAESTGHEPISKPTAATSTQGKSTPASSTIQPPEPPKPRVSATLVEPAPPVKAPEPAPATLAAAGSGEANDQDSVHRIAPITTGGTITQESVNAQLARLPNVFQGDVSVLNLRGDALFASGADSLGEAADKELSILATTLKKSPNTPILIRGYTDDRGSEKGNLALSTRRAKAVRDWLMMKLDLPAKNVTVIGMGASEPVAPNKDDQGKDNPEGRAKNRRVTVTFPKGVEAKP